MKGEVQKKYYKRVRAVLKSKLNGGNVINAINICAVATGRGRNRGIARSKEVAMVESK